MSTFAQTKSEKTSPGTKYKVFGGDSLPMKRRCLGGLEGSKTAGVQKGSPRRRAQVMQIRWQCVSFRSFLLSLWHRSLDPMAVLALQFTGNDVHVGWAWTSYRGSQSSDAELERETSCSGFSTLVE